MASRKKLPPPLTGQHSCAATANRHCVFAAAGEEVRGEIHLSKPSIAAIASFATLTGETPLA
jgi:hypothetical protein